MKPAAGGSLFYDCFHPRGPKPLKTWFGAITRAWGGMFDCCGGGEEGGNRNFVRVGDRMVPRGRPVTASEWEYLEARAVVVVSPRIGVSCEGNFLTGGGGVDERSLLFFRIVR